MKQMIDLKLGKVKIGQRLKAARKQAGVGVQFVIFSSSRSEVFLVKSVLKYAVNLQENTSAWMFSSKFAAYFRNTFY